MNETPTNNGPVVEKRKRSKTPWVLLGLILGLLLGGLIGTVFSNALSSMLNIATDSPKNVTTTLQNGNSRNDNDHGGRGSDDHSDISHRLTGLEGASQRYGQYLAEASRESTDAPSAEAVAAQSSLTKATSELASSITSEAKTKNGNTNESDIEAKLSAVNNSFIQYTAAAANGSPNEGEATRAVNDLQTYLDQNFEVRDRTLQPLLTSFKNAMLEGNRQFVAQSYESAYAKHMQSQQDFVRALATLQTK